MKNLKVSVIIPAYNAEKTLRQCLDSVLNQTYKNYEVIVADASSTDKTVEIAEKFGAKVVKGGLPGAGRNRGAEASQGEIILFLDADVVLKDKDYFKKTLSEFEEKKLDIATCIPEPLDGTRFDKATHRAFALYAQFVKLFFPHAPGFCIFVRKKLHNLIGGFDEKVKLAEDHDYAHRAARRGKFDILDSAKIPVSVRRFDRDGRLKIIIKYLLCELHILTKGSIKSDIFNYQFGHTKKNRNV